MCRRRGSAIALNGSDEVGARGMRAQYIPIWEYVKSAYQGEDTKGTAKVIDKVTVYYTMTATEIEAEAAPAATKKP